MKKLFFIIAMLVTVTAVAQYTVYHGEEFTATATPNAGWQFVGWYDGETLVSTDNPYTWVVTESVNLTAKFERIALQININVVPEGAGSVTTNIIGQVLEIKAVPNLLHTFKHFDTPEGIIKENPMRWEMNTEASIVAVFQRSGKLLWVLGGLFIFALILFFKP